MHPAFIASFIAESERRARRRSSRRVRAGRRQGDGPAAGEASGPARPPERGLPAGGEILLRPARPDDARQLRRLGGLDVSSRFGDRLAALARDGGPGLVIVAEGSAGLLAALDTAEGRIAADPFAGSAPARELLQLRAAQLARSRADGSPAWTDLLSHLHPRPG